MFFPGADPGFDRGGAPDRDRPKTAILGPQFCRILVLGPHFWWSGGAQAPGAPWIRPCFQIHFCKNTSECTLQQESRKSYDTADKALLALYLLYLNKIWFPRCRLNSTGS